MRKGLVWFAALAIAAAMVSSRADAQTTPAQTWPAKPIRIIVPYPPGGLSDVFARLIGDKLARVLGQSVVIDNPPVATPSSAPRRRRNRLPTATRCCSPTAR